MCGIAGAYWWDSTRPSDSLLEDAVRRALGVIQARGPDESSTSVIGRGCVMGGNRLIIRGGHGIGTMPFRSAETLVYYNGEFYDYRELDAQAHSDGEIVIPVYEAAGVAGFEWLDGEFAIALWDDRRQELLLVRDQFGTKPLYFSLDDRRLLWGSSASAINAIESHPFCAAEKSSVYTSTYSVQEPYTSFSGIWSVPPGHALAVSAGRTRLVAYHSWNDATLECDDYQTIVPALQASLRKRMDYAGTIGIPLSAGIDSGIIAFMAEALGVRYQTFSVVEMFGRRTPESQGIIERSRRLKNAEAITFLKCDRNEYERALDEMFSPDYYDSERFDGGSVATNVVFNAMRDAGIRVALDGTGGDELFHGYRFRENFRRPKHWPHSWRHTNYFYSLYTSLLDYTGKADRAGAHFSIECRYPYQSLDLARQALRMQIRPVHKWPLRQFLLRETGYGPALPADTTAKYGFSLENFDTDRVVCDMQRAWCRANSLSLLPSARPVRFPFVLGRRQEKQ